MLKRLRNEHPEHDPFGVMAAWLVEDAVDAYYMLRDRAVDSEDRRHG